jgi:hypothetical protein
MYKKRRAGKMADQQFPPFDSVNEKSQVNTGDYMLKRKTGRTLGIMKAAAR